MSKEPNSADRRAALEAGAIIADTLENVSCPEGQATQMQHRQLEQQRWSPKVPTTRAVANGTSLGRGITSGSISAEISKKRVTSNWKLKPEEEKMPGHFAEGPRSPGFVLPASAVSEQENYGGSKKPQSLLCSGFASTTSSPQGL
jgi:hypothetical protein